MMRRKEKEIIDQNIIEEILTNSFICRVAFFDEEYPYIVPMNYGYRDNTLYFHCGLQGRKIDLIKRNNKVGFEIEHKHEIIKNAAIVANRGKYVGDEFLIAYYTTSSSGSLKSSNIY